MSIGSIYRRIKIAYAGHVMRHAEKLHKEVATEKAIKDGEDIRKLEREATGIVSKLKAGLEKLRVSSDAAYEKERALAVARGSKLVGVADVVAGRRELDQVEALIAKADKLLGKKPPEG